MENNYPDYVKICDRVYLLLPGFSAITAWPCKVYIREKDTLDIDRTVAHESIHWPQQRETFGLFYLWYPIEWMIKGIYYKFKPRKDGTGAYRNISFEREAYENQYNEDYLKTRKRFAWFKYIIKNN